MFLNSTVEIRIKHAIVFSWKLKSVSKCAFRIGATMTSFLIWVRGLDLNVGYIYIFCFFPPVMVTRAQTITVADESLVLVISWLTPRLLGLQAHTVNADTEGNEKIT